MMIVHSNKRDIVRDNQVQLNFEKISIVYRQSNHIHPEMLSIQRTFPKVQTENKQFK